MHRENIGHPVEMWGGRQVEPPTFLSFSNPRDETHAGVNLPKSTTSAPNTLKQKKAIKAKHVYKTREESEMNSPYVQQSYFFFFFFSVHS